MLLARGHQVEIVAMIDPPPVSHGVWEVADDKIWQAYDERLAIYRPSPLAVPLVLFMSEQNPEPWCRVSSECQLFEAPGGHFDWITIRADTLADALKRRLGRERTSITPLIAHSPE